ncbi:MAG: alpha/beta fold hydrolase, partial [Halomonas sp.]
MTDAATVDLHYLDMESEGTPDATPLVVIHGLMGSADNWRSHLKVW